MVNAKNVGASSPKIENTDVQITTKSESKEITTKKKPMFPVTFSCGITFNYDVANGVSTGTVLALIWYYDSILCG